MAKSTTRLLFLVAVVVAASCDDDSPNGTAVGPTVTSTQVGAAPAQPPLGPLPFPNNPSPPLFPPAPNFPPAPSQLPAPNHPIFGPATAVTGVCPVIRLTVGGRVVVTDRSTIFVLACRALREDTLVRVQGRILPGGTMIATAVEPR